MSPSVHAWEVTPEGFVPGGTYSGTLRHFVQVPRRFMGLSLRSVSRSHPERRPRLRPYFAARTIERCAACPGRCACRIGDCEYASHHEDCGPEATCTAARSDWASQRQCYRRGSVWKRRLSSSHLAPPEASSVRLSVHVDLCRPSALNAYHPNGTFKSTARN
jgi:hypothetical protein